MINIRLLTAAAAAVALLCLTGCQPKEDPLYLGNNAIVLETDEGRNGLYVKDADIGGASGDSLFGERCFIDCSHAQLYYYGLGRFTSRSSRSSSRTVTSFTRLL